MNKTFLKVALALAFISSSCGEDEVTEVLDPISVNFRSSTISIGESETAESIIIEFSEPAPIDGTITLQLTEQSAVYGEDFTTQPAPSGNNITLNVNENSSQAILVVVPVSDQDDESHSFTLSINATSSPIIEIGSNSSSTITIAESGNNGGSGNGNNTGNGTCNGTSYPTGTVQCSPSLSNDNLDIVTWNIEFFPNSGNTTISKVIDIINELNADVYAVQEINNINSFNSLVSSLNNYEGQVVNIGGSLDLGFIYKTSEITSVSAASELNLGISPRDPVVIDITHSNGLSAKLLNIHLKCCGGSGDIEQREDASEKLKNYIDSNLPNEEVIVLGDWNEDFVNGSDSFDNFIQDSDNYIFADLPINDGSSSDFSYPSWPSHLDHILVTNELCDNLVASYTVRLDDCVSSYFSQVSDHRPVMVTLRAD